MRGRITTWPPVPVSAYLRRPAARLPFPLDDDRGRIFKSARLGLLAGLRLLPLRAGDVVLAPAYHHSCEIEVLTGAGLTVSFYDSRPDLSPDPDELESLLTPDVRGLYLIHYLGFAQDGPFWSRWCRERDLLLIEDAAMAWPGTVACEPIGSHGDLAIFSPWKAVGLPDPGAVWLAPGYELPRPPAPRGFRPRALLAAHRDWLAQRYGVLAPTLDPGTPTPAADRATGDLGKRPSRSCRFLLPRLWREEVATRRRANYRMLLERLSDLVDPPFDEPGGGIFPFALPVGVAGKRELIAGLQAIGVEPFDLWAHPHPLLEVERFPEARRRRAMTVALPVHQYLDVARLTAIAARVRELVDGQVEVRPAAPRTLMPGDPAIDFELPDHEGRPFRLASMRGRTVVLYFFPEAGTPGCTAEACDLRNGSAELAEFDAVPVGISPDPPELLHRFEREHSLGHVLLSDRDGAAAHAWGVSRPRGALARRLGTHGDGGRITFVVDPDGIVRATVAEVDVGRHARQVLETLEDVAPSRAPAA